MTESDLHEVSGDRDVTVSERLFNETAVSNSRGDREKPPLPRDHLAGKQPPVFSRQSSGRLVMGDDVLEKLLAGRSPASKRFALRRLKLLLNRCSKEVREEKLPVGIVNRLADFCLGLLPLLEDAKLVIPTAVEMSTLFNWYLRHCAGQAPSAQEPAVVLTTVCPDYPYQPAGTKAVFTSGNVGDDIGLIGECIINSAPPLLDLFSQSLELPLVWIIGYAGFEAKPENLERMKMTAAEFKGKLETSALKLQQEIGAPVGILPEAVGLTPDQFNKIRNGFLVEDFNIKRRGMDALADAVDARDWAGVFCIASHLNAVIVDGASVYMGRKAYTKARQILNPENYTPQFYCVCNYQGFAG
jgi:hypothetical protein